MPIDDPWRGIDPPTEENRITARRIPDAGTHEWGLYWAMDSQRHSLLILQHRSEHRRSHRLPRLKGLRVEALPTEDGSGERLVIRLTDGEQREVFHRFCMDIVDATRNAGSGAEAVQRFLIRTWRWHRLLRGGGDARLSREEQKGLIGELHVLDKHLLSLISLGEAVRAWTGPIGAPKDFQVGWVGIEAKTRSPQAPSVRISSAEQLDATESTRLFLHVTEISGSHGGSSLAVTVTDVAAGVRDKIMARDMAAAIQFEELLNAAGFDWNDDYSDGSWLIGDDSLFEVRDDFPCITSSMFKPGVKDVQYAIELAQCENFHVEAIAVAQAISGESDGC